MIHEPTVFVVDDDPAGRRSLQWLLESVGLQVRLYASAQEFLTAYDDNAPGCLVLDVRMPGMSGLELQERLVTNGVTLPIIIVTGYAEVGIAVRAMKSGALDFLEKPFDEQTLLARVQTAIKLDAKLRSEAAARDGVMSRLAALTPRERQVLEMVVAGKPTKQIAVRLQLSPKTVEIHRAHVMDKMRAGSLAELVHRAVAAGIHVEEPAPLEQSIAPPLGPASPPSG